MGKAISGGKVVAQFHYPEKGQLCTWDQVQVQSVIKSPCDDNLNPHYLRGDDPFTVLQRGIMRTAIVVDVHNLYLGSLRNYPGKVVNYTVLTSYFASLGNSLFHKLAFGRQPEEKVAQFAKMLRRNGFQLYFGNHPHNIEMTLKIADLIEHRALDHLILGTNYFEAGRLLAHARNRGIYTTVFGFDMPRAFENYAEVMEIPVELLQERPAGDNLEPELPQAA